MSRALHNNEQRPNRVPNYAQSNKTQQTRGYQPQQQQQQGDGEKPHYVKNSNNYNKSGFTSQSSYQKNSYNKPKDSTYGYHKKTHAQFSVVPPSDTTSVQFGSINQPINTPIPTDTTTDKTGDVSVVKTTEVQFGSLPAVTETSTNYRPQQKQQKDPNASRTTNDGRLFTQAYVPRPDLNHGKSNYNNQNNNQNNRYHYNNNNNYRNNGYVRPSSQPHHSPNQPFHHQVQYSPQQLNQSPQQTHNLPPSPMSHRASPNLNAYSNKKNNPNNLSPHIPQSTPQNVTWSPQFYYAPQYPIGGVPYNVPSIPRGPIVPPPTTRKAIAIIDPNTGTAVDTSPMTLATQQPPTKEEKHFEFVKQPQVSKAVVIVDPAIRDRELREKKEREEEEKRKAEEEERRKVEEEEKRKAEEERLEQERIEAEKRKAEEEEESKRILSELEAEKKAQEAAAAAAAAAATANNGRLPSPLDMSNIHTSQSPVASPVATKKVPKVYKKIQDVSQVQYPSGIIAPSTHENKLAYSIDFLLQFRQVCLDTDVVDLTAVMKELGIGENSNSRSSSMRQSSDRGRTPRTPNTPHMISPDPTYKTNSRDGRMEMGKFNMGRPLTPRNNSNMMERQGSHGGNRGGGMMGRGGGRGGIITSSGMKIIRNPLQQNPGPNTPPIEPVKPLEFSENRWAPSVGTKAAQAPAEGELMSQEYIIRKVNALLNKLTVEKFDSISKQIFEYALQSEKENDGRSLRTVIKLTFEKACDEPAFASMWARLCRSMYDATTENIRDTSILDDNQNPVSGVLLYRKYLFNRCQTEFEKGWKVNMPVGEEAENLMSDEYYAAAKAKRQGLGLIQFIGELFKLEMLSERIMYNCMIKLCNDPLNAGDEEAESLCKLLTTIGKALDSKPKTAKWVDIVVARMKNEMVHSPKLTSRVKFMIQDLLDLRKDKWVPRHVSTQIGPTTIAKIHEMAEKDKEEKEAASMKRTNSARGQYIPNNNQNNNGGQNMSRTGSYRGNKENNNHDNNNSNNSNNNNNNNNTGADGWSTVSPGANKNRISDLSNFGKTDRSRSRTNILSPSYGPFASLGRGKNAASTEVKNDARSNSAANIFSALSSGDVEQTEERKEPSPPKPKLTDEVVKRKSKNILEEYFSINDKKELCECVKELDDPDYLVIFIGEMLSVVEKKAQDVEKMSETIRYLNTENLLQKNQHIKAFKNFMEGYDDLTIDVPQAPKYVAQLLHAASVTPDEVGGDEFGSLQRAYMTLVVS